MRPLVRSVKPPSLNARKALSLLLPLFYLLGVLYFDWITPFRTVTPSLCEVGLLTIALLLPPAGVVCWAVVYSTVVAAVLLNQGVFSALSNGYHAPEIVSHLFRTAGFLVTAVFACIFSYLLTKLRRKRAALHHLILRLPLPVLLSDSGGRIVLANNEARELLGLPSDDGPVLHSFFDLLAPRTDQGDCILTYLGLFQKGAGLPESIALEHAGVPLVARIELVEGPPSRLITMLLRPDKGNVEEIP